MKGRNTYNRAMRARQRLAGKWQVFSDAAKKQCAGWLDRKINPLPVAKKRWLLYFFCIVGALNSIWLLSSPFLTTGDVAIRIAPVHLRLQQNDDKSAQAKAFITEEQYHRIHAFKLFLDSLAGESTGQDLYDSIVKSHPGINDSLQKIENYYQLQQ